jgi:hypothetical protein
LWMGGNLGSLGGDRAGGDRRIFVRWVDLIFGGGGRGDRVGAAANFFSPRPRT